MGYDVAIGREFSLSPTVSYYRALGASLTISGANSGLRINDQLLQLGLAVQWHWSPVSSR